VDLGMTKVVSLDFLKKKKKKSLHYHLSGERGIDEAS
jgi:hypothetical protein